MNPYEVLGVDESSDIKQIKKAYKNLALKYHPDKNKGNDEMFKKINEAYKKLIEIPNIINIIVEYSLEDIYNGCTKNVSYWDIVSCNCNNKCKLCENGLLKKEKTITLKLERGFNTTNKIYNNLNIIFVEKQHDIFKRSGNNLIMYIEIDINEIDKNKTMFFKHLNGKNIKIKLNDIVMHNDVRLVKGKGLPIDDKKYGDLYIKFIHVKRTLE